MVFDYIKYHTSNNMYLMRLDDASEYMDANKWKRMELLLDRYGIKPIYGIIPNNEDPELLKYGKVDGFWDLMVSLGKKGWTPALHGYTHAFETNEGGINPVNALSEFAGVTLDRQKQKIRDGLHILEEHGIYPDIFFAPAHTFDENTISALREESRIRIICDTIANDVYFQNGFYYIPQQSGHCRRLPFKVTTFCYHPNTMNDTDFDRLEVFLKSYSNYFVSVNLVRLRHKKKTILDIILKQLYFFRKRM